MGASDPNKVTRSRELKFRLQILFAASTPEDLTKSGCNREIALARYCSLQILAPAFRWSEVLAQWQRHSLCATIWARPADLWSARFHPLSSGRFVLYSKTQCWRSARDWPCCSTQAHLR